jgi:hypothetical protein
MPSFEIRLHIRRPILQGDLAAADINSIESPTTISRAPQKIDHRLCARINPMQLARQNIDVCSGHWEANSDRDNKFLQRVRKY